MLGLLPDAPPPPRRKADMMAAIEGRLFGDSLRELWDRLDETRQLPGAPDQPSRNPRGSAPQTP